ncbi:DNA primase [Candidatus Vecturithrix granuli]|uniref:DNA primase n=1 Tax=Vecturithrix granuli TaxID=1499967 RepID=A0A081C5E7_VECG1|nr:DNA primase [Candidatus Vecturithrix granuli]
MASKYIPDDLINAVRQQADIVEIISEYVPLEHTGKNYKGLCPFHKEKTPSFVVNPDMQLFKCYGCGVGGNVFTFLMQYEKYTFPEAVHVVAQRVGISLSSTLQQQTSPEYSRKKKLFQLHLEAAQYFSRQLLHNDQAKPVREYLQRRGIDAKMIETFSLGYALPDWDDLRKTFLVKYPAELLLQSGLLIKKENGSGEYDRFRNRLMIPIHDHQGKVIAFGGRAMEHDAKAKYLNSPESPIFHKANTLFGFHQAKDAIRRTETIVIVEGYFDMIVPYSHGVQNIVATMGTALTEQHMRLLQHVKNVIWMFDADTAGIRAAFRTLDLMLQYGREPRSVILPPGEDPDSLVRKVGVEEFQRVIEEAPLLLDFIRAHIIKKYDINKVEHQIACAKEILPIILKIQSEAVRNIQIRRTADWLRVTDKSLMEEFKKIAETGKIQFLPRAQQQGQERYLPIPRLEQYLLKALLKDKRLIADIRTELDPQEVSHPVTRKVLETLFIFEDKTDFEAKVLDLFQGTSVQNDLTDLFLDLDEIIDPARTVQDCLRQLRQRRFEHQTLDLSRKVRDAQEQRNDDTIERFLEQKNRDLLKKKQHYG